MPWHAMGRSNGSLATWNTCWMCNFPPRCPGYAHMSMCKSDSWTKQSQAGLWASGVAIVISWRLRKTRFLWPAGTSWFCHVKHSLHVVLITQKGRVRLAGRRCQIPRHESSHPQLSSPGLAAKRESKGSSNPRGGPVTLHSFAGCLGSANGSFPCEGMVSGMVLSESKCQASRKRCIEKRVYIG